MRRRAWLLVCARALAHTPPRHDSARPPPSPSSPPPSSSSTLPADTSDTTAVATTTSTTAAAPAATQDDGDDVVTRARREAEARGFARRDTAEARALLSHTFPDRYYTEDGVAIANLPPPAPHPVDAAFATYKRSTSDYTSQLTPYGGGGGGTPTGVGLGAGFGARADKRLGFLRPRNAGSISSSGSSDSHSSLATASSSDGVGSGGGGTDSLWRARGAPAPRYDEHGMLVPRTDREALEQAKLYTEAQLRQRSARHMQSVQGSMYSSQEHPLLIDLDFYKDAHVFGYTRDEFVRNVGKLRAVILAYEKWERTDKAYRYATVALKVVTVLLLIECVQQYCELQMFARYYDEFVDTLASNEADAEATRARDMARAHEQLTRQPPDFAPVVAAIAAERARLQRDEAADAQKGSGTHSNTVLGALRLAATAATAASPSPSRRSVAAVMLDDSAPHPMDTAHESSDAAEARRRAREREMARLHASFATHTQPPSTLAALWGRLVRDHRHRARHDDGSDGTDDNAAAALTQTRTRRRSSSLHQPLQQDDFVRYSYAASPTSVAAVRAVRRVLLPRSEDYTQVVREEMAAHVRAKAQRNVAPPHAAG